MKQLTCPLDGKPCEANCPDRYKDRPEGGCTLTTAREQGAQIIDFGGGDVGMLFLPHCEAPLTPGESCDCRDNKKAAPSAANTEDGKAEKVLRSSNSASYDTEN